MNPLPRELLILPICFEFVSSMFLIEQNQKHLKFLSFERVRWLTLLCFDWVIPYFWSTQFRQIHEIVLARISTLFTWCSAVYSILVTAIVSTKARNLSPFTFHIIYMAFISLFHLRDRQNLTTCMKSFVFKHFIFFPSLWFTQQISLIENLDSDPSYALMLLSGRRLPEVQHGRPVTRPRLSGRKPCPRQMHSQAFPPNRRARPSSQNMISLLLKIECAESSFSQTAESSFAESQGWPWE
jgi:hypothetical protein